MLGELRVYLGAAPGVGKTYALLDEARRRASRGARVVVTGVSADAPPTTAALVDALRGEVVALDVKTILAREPEVVALDDIARPGRLLVADELRAAGIHVVTTLDVGEIASLAPLVEGLTGQPPRGTIPDVALAGAAVELIDSTPEALRRRLAHGNVVAAEDLDAGLANVFRPENLAACRRLALRWLADHLDRTDLPMPDATERVAVAVTGAPGADAVVRRAARLAARSNAGLVGIHVRSGAASAEEVEAHRRLLEDLGGVYREVAGRDIAEALVATARAEGATELVVGATRRGRLQELVRGSLVRDITRQTAGHLDVVVVGARDDGPRSTVGPRRRPPALSVRRRTVGWLIVVAGLPLITVTLNAIEDVDLSVALLVYLLGVTAAAAAGGTYPAAAAALGAFLLANWFFIPPLHQWEIDDAKDFVSLLTFIVVAAVVASLVVRAARQTATADRARAEARTLAGLSGASVHDDPLATLVAQVVESFDLDAAVVRRTSDGYVEAKVGELGTPSLVLRLGSQHELAASGPPVPAAGRAVLSVVGDHLIAALQHRRLREEASSAAALAEANELRTAILAAVSHDLRTPLSSIKASVSSLRQDDVTWSPDDEAEYLATIEEETDRLDVLVGNLLDLSRLQTNTLQILEREVGVDEVVPAAVASVASAHGRVDVDVPESLPRVKVDAGLLERAVANLVANAVEWSPPDSVVRIDAASLPGRIDVRIVDHGPGIPRDARDRVFEPFQRLGDSDRDGVGLGLAVARGFINAMHGELRVEDTPGGGTTMVVSLPVLP